MQKYTQIELLFRQSNGIMTTKELINKGISHYYIKKMVHGGFLEPLKRGLYKLSKDDIDESIVVLSMVPKGVLCLFSSASIHELTTTIPFTYHVAIPKKVKSVCPIILLFNYIIGTLLYTL